MTKLKKQKARKVNREEMATTKERGVVEEKKRKDHKRGISD